MRNLSKNANPDCGEMSWVLFTFEPCCELTHSSPVSAVIKARIHIHTLRTSGRSQNTSLCMNRNFRIIQNTHTHTHTYTHKSTYKHTNTHTHIQKAHSTSDVNQSITKLDDTAEQKVWKFYILLIT